MKVSVTTLGRYDTPSKTWGIDVIHNIAYIAEQSGLRIIDVYDPIHPYIIGFSPEDYNVCIEVVIFNGIAYVSCSMSGFRIIDISNPYTPNLITIYDTSQFHLAWHVFISNDLCYLSTGSDGIFILDMNNVSNPSVLGRYNDSNAGVLETFVMENILYASYSHRGLMIFDVSNSSDIILIANYSTKPWVSRSLFVSNNIVYLACEVMGILIFDVINPFHPILIGHHNVSGDSPFHISVMDHIAYISARFAGLEIVDVMNPFNPILIGRYETNSRIYSTHIDYITNTKHIVYIAEFENGLKILEVSFERSSFIPLIVIILFSVVFFSVLLFLFFKSRLIWWYRFNYDKFYLFFPLLGIANFVSDILFIIYLTVNEYILFVILSLFIFILSILFNYLRIGKWWFRKINHCREQSTTDLIREYIKNNITVFNIVLYLSIIINPHLLFILRSGLIFSNFHFQFPINERDMSISNLCILNDFYSVIPSSVLLCFVAVESPFDWPLLLMIILMLKICNLLILLGRGMIFIFLGDEIRAIPGYKMKNILIFATRQNGVPSLISDSYIDVSSSIDSSIEMNNSSFIK